MRSFKKRFFVSFVLWISLGVVISIIQAPLLSEVSEFSGAYSKLFFVAVFFTHYFILALPSAVLFFIFTCITKNRHLLSALACVLALLSMLYSWVDIYVYNLYGYHMDGMFLSLFTNPATSDSVEITWGTRLTIGLRVAVLLVSMPFIYAAMMKIIKKVSHCRCIGPRISAVQNVFLLAFAALVLFEKSSFAVAWVEKDTEITNVRSIMGPFYLTIAPSSLMRDLGFDDEDANGNPVILPRGNIDNYPINEIEIDENAPRPNVIVFVVESAHKNIDASMIPNISALAENYVSSETHYSGGNCTRFGFSAIFYGLHTTYWHDLLAAKRPPVLFGVLRERGYKINAYASNNLNFPEFRSTVFVGLEEGEIRDSFAETVDIVDRDRITADRVLKDIADYDGTPFCTVAFVAASHYPYRYPSEFEKALPVMPIEDVDLVRQGIKGEPDVMEKIRNRSRNSISYADALAGEIISALKDKGIFENTAIFIVGDHGQEFCDLGKGKGHMGHNGAFSTFQTKTLFAAHIPNAGKRVISRITSHYDIAPTILKAVGVKNPESDYADGISLLEESGRKYVLMASWTEAALTDGDKIIKFGYGSHNIGCLNVYDANYRELKNASELSQYLKTIFADYMADRCRFLRMDAARPLLSASDSCAKNKGEPCRE